MQKHLHFDWDMLAIHNGELIVTENKRVNPERLAELDNRCGANIWSNRIWRGIVFRPIRKKSNEISIAAAKKLLAEARRGVLAVNGDDGYPYAIPVNYYYDEANQRIYFHGARVGHKVDALKNCDKVCFTVFGPEAVKAEPWAPFVQSVVVFGRCHLTDASSVAQARLKQFAMKYYPNEAAAKEEIARSGKAVQMYEIEIEHISGKEVQER